MSDLLKILQLINNEMGDFSFVFISEINSSLLLDRNKYLYEACSGGKQRIR